MMALLAILEMHDVVYGEQYGDESLTVYSVTVGIWVYVEGQKVLQEIGKTYAYHYVNMAPGADAVHTYWIDAGAEVSCGCGLNMYWAWIADKEWHEVYEGSTLTDYTWAICCGDNHLLVGKGSPGWEPVIDFADPIENSTCTLDDGTVCALTILAICLHVRNVWDFGSVFSAAWFTRTS